jgi:hypothetical protein
MESNEGLPNPNGNYNKAPLPELTNTLNELSELCHIPVEDLKELLEEDDDELEGE